MSGVLTVGPSDGSLEELRGGLGFWGVGAVSLRPGSFQRILVRTVRTARAACLKSTPAMLIRDRLDVLFEDEEFVGLYPSDGRPGLSPGQLALVSVLQLDSVGDLGVSPWGNMMRSNAQYLWIDLWDGTRRAYLPE
ncbi:hypothetical protein ACFZDK_54020 [Streptomyces sp. NPDC007901]|uniref:hypothetical protein n=1 Tax=Streptomyces sp. NPDC007901 TaxID=3364785 RepID=UPI0036E34E05